MKGNSALMEQLEKYYEVWREGTALYEEWSKAHGISFNSVMVLYSLHEEGNRCTQKMICRKWVMQKQTVNAILKDFEQRGLIEFKALSSDKRNKLICPTEEGRRYADEVISELRKLELFVIENVGLERMKRLNEDMELFMSLFRSGMGGK